MKIHLLYQGKNWKNAGINVVIVPPYQKVFEYQKELIKVFKENQYDIVHSHENTLSVFPLRAAKKANIKVRIAHSHSTTNKKERKKDLLKQILRPFSKVYATDYFCCTEHAGRWLFGNKEFDKGNVYIMNNAIDVEKFSFNERARKLKRQELNIADNAFVIGHIGRFVEQKNHSLIIDIFNELHKEDENTVLLLIGQGPLLEQIKEKVKELSLDDCVMFLGQRDDVNLLYQGMDCFLFPSLYEGLGMTLIEAQCSGLPCIASKEVPEIAKIIDSTCFIDLNEDLKTWKDNIIKSKYYQRKSYLEQLERNGYDISRECKKLENIYLKKGVVNNENISSST